MTIHGVLPGPTRRSPGRHREGAERPVTVEEAGPSGHSRSRLGRGDDEARAGRSLEGELEYVYDRGFDHPDAEATFLPPVPSGVHEEPPRPEPPKGLSPYLASIYGLASLLRPEQEAALFLKMNYLKYRVSKLREALDPPSARASDLDEIERLQGEARAVKDQIVRANLRLVVSIARSRARTGRDFLDLVSEGNLTLLLAVEKFDVSRGFKFSSYASSAIIRSLSRTTGQEIGLRRQFVTGHQDFFNLIADGANDDYAREGRRHGDQEAVRKMLDRLSGRERTVIVARFGLGEVRQQTLRELSEELGITKERVRQIEWRAREKLREFAREEGLDPTAA